MQIRDERKMGTQRSSYRHLFESANALRALSMFGESVSVTARLVH
jgi:hypothetical protein